MASVKSGDLKLASDLHSWATSTMKLTQKSICDSGKIPSVDELNVLCRGQMSDIWKHVISRVHSCQTVRNVKGNLALKRMQQTRSYTVQYKSNTSYDAKTAERYELRNSLLSDIKSVMSATQQLERDIDDLQQNISAAEQSYRRSSNQLNETTHKSKLLNSRSQFVAQDLERIDELAGRVRQKLQILRDSQRKSPVMLSKDQSSGDGGSTISGLETACVKSVRKTCELIATFFHKLLQGGFERDEAAMVRSKDELWNAVHSVLSSFSSTEILSALSVYADNTSFSLHQKTSVIDIRKDAEQLRFKYEMGGHLSDLSTPPSVLQSVHQLLEVSQAAIFARFIETEKYRNETCKMQRRLAEASRLLDDMLCRQFSNGERLQLARSILEIETRVASTKAVIKALDVVSVDLEKKVKHETAEKEILHTKYQKIQDFEKLTGMKQNLIRVLVKQNMNARARLVSQQSENVLYAERSLTGHEASIQQFTASLKNCVTTEAEAFIRLSLPLLPNVTMGGEQKVSVVDLSIYKLGQIPHVACAQLLSKLLQKIDAPYIASECLLQTIAELQSESYGVSLALKLVPKSDQRTLQRINELCLEVKKHDEETVEKLMPVLQKRLAEATQTLTDCLQVKDLAKDWWDQPGQFCVPWVTVDGLTLKQWRDKWTVSATRLRQLSVKAH